MTFLYRLRIKGFVQGIGFRPFVYKLATDMHLKGWVNNDTEGVNVVIEASEEQLNTFVTRLRAEKPALAEIKQIETVKEPLGAERFEGFSIRSSGSTSSYAADVLPDLATCPECLNDINDPKNRRYQYLFTNCTYCGPRFSIIEALPYDRKNTTMARFLQCEECQSEYDHPLNRRFHAQPNACARCGPEVFLQTPNQQEVSRGFQALEQTVEKIKEGAVIALKGIGGYQLVVDAKNSEALLKLRQRKRRRRKPFAVMMSSLDEIREYCEITPIEAQQLTSVAAPIVLLATRNEGLTLAPEVAPNNPYLGVFLPNTPLHHWLLKLFQGPLVVTSANLSDEPLAFREPEVFERLAGIADWYLTHNRPIARPIDDSVVQVVDEKVFVLRAARGLAPLTLARSESADRFATGPHMKATFALQVKNKLILSQHLGDLEADKSQQLFESEYQNYLQFNHWQPEEIVHDAHPSYFTTEWAQEKLEQSREQHSVLRLTSCQHHRAHIYATLAEAPVQGSFLGIAWDGTGYGDDGTIWGSEFFLGGTSRVGLQRVAHLSPFCLLGGESAVRSPWRVALALLFECDVELAKRWFLHFHSDKPISDFEVLLQMWQKQLNAPKTTSMGRFLEGVSALLGIVQVNEFDADAAMQLEFSATRFRPRDQQQKPRRSLPPSLVRIPWNQAGDLHLLDWRPWVRDAVFVVMAGFPSENLADQIHACLIESVFALTSLLGETQIVLGGGVFQNRILLSGLLQRGREKNISVQVPSRIPLNDGGVAIGQLHSPS